MKPDWVAMCPEAEHLLSPCPVLISGASVGWPRLGLGLRAGREGTRQRDGHVLVEVGFGGERVEAAGTAMGSVGRLSPEPP